jgi:hypothetical protein
MNQVETAELALRRAQDQYKAAIEAEQQKQAQQGVQTTQQQPPPPQQPEGTRLIDLDKITTVEDVVAIMKVTGIRIFANPEQPTYEFVEHLVVDDEDAEADDAPE